MLYRHCFLALFSNMPLGMFRKRRTQQLLVYADDIKLLVDNIDTSKKNAETLIDAIKDVCLQIHAVISKHMLRSRRQNTGQNRDIKIANRCFENVAQFRYLEMRVTNQNFIQEKIKRSLNSRNTCYHSVQNFYPLVCCLKT
jgi:hypothetical protein